MTTREVPTENTSPPVPKRTPGKRRKRLKYRKAPQAPKRPKSAFVFFTMARHDVKKTMEEKEGKRGRTADIAKNISEEWRNLSPEDRTVWDEKARLDKERYEVESAIYINTRPRKMPAKSQRAPKRPRSSVLSLSGSKSLGNMAESEPAKSYQKSVTSAVPVPKTWSGSSTSFIKFLLFAKETDASFIPELDRMMLDHEKLVNSLTTENKELKEKLNSKIDSLKKRVYNKSKLVKKLTKMLTECQWYIIKLTDELRRLYKEREIEQPRDKGLDSTKSQSQRQLLGVVEANLSRMLAEERSNAETLEAINKNLSDDLSATKKELEDLEKELSLSDDKKVELEASSNYLWKQLEELIVENKHLQDELACAVIELDNDENSFRFNQRETKAGMLRDDDDNRMPSTHAAAKRDGLAQLQTLHPLLFAVANRALTAAPRTQLPLQAMDRSIGGHG